ncbi:MAG TPA: squalene--hopene cyclase [Acidimicrobiales bacterium]|jgi:squalene-hopene/tetraprenyl-beta-curcumene cyclase
MTAVSARSLGSPARSRPSGAPGRGTGGPAEHEALAPTGGLGRPDDAEYKRTAAALDGAVRALRDLQDDAGWWKGELETNVTMDAEDMLLREFLGIRTAEQTAASAAWIRSQQRADGTWATYYGGPGDLSTTVEAYVALRLAGDGAEAAHMRQAAGFVRASGGVERTRVFTRFWLALFGLWPWERLPVLPPEMLLLPRWVPLNIYDFGCWARQTVVALTVVGSYQPVQPLSFAVDELKCGTPDAPLRSLRTWAGRFDLADRALRAYGRRPIGALRELALARAERWIVQRQEADGSWGGIQPPWVYTLMALRLRGYSLSHPVMAAGVSGLERFVIDDERGRRLEACQSPVWDTALAMVALGDAGVDPADPALERAGRWLLDEEIRVPGDWSIRRPGLAPGGWAFEFHNDTYPDVDDTAEVVLALLRLDAPGDDPQPDPESARRQAAIDRAVNWTAGMQCRDGGWAAFDVDNTRSLCRELPFCDFGELIDPPTADVTAHVVEMLAALGSERPDTGRAVRWLLDAQEPDGSWYGRWGANFVYGTGAVVPALVAAGVAPSDPAVRRAVSWLASCQNPDGGWGEDLRSYRDEGHRGRGTSTASQTAWALLALLAAGERGPLVGDGIDFLVRTQLPDGNWDEPWFTGTGFPGDFYINYHLYRLVFPTMALGRYLRLTDGAPEGVRGDGD